MSLQEDGLRRRQHPHERLDRAGPRKASLSAGTKVTVIGTVSGGSWSATCAGDGVSGSSWYKINQVNGKSTVVALRRLRGLRRQGPVHEHQLGHARLEPHPHAEPRPQPKPPGQPDARPRRRTCAPIIEGIDVSHWQGTIDWAKVTAAGKRFAYIKATESTDFIDNMYATNRAQAKANGIKVGAYHFARPETNSGDAVNEANWFIKNAAPCPASCSRSSTSR